MFALFEKLLLAIPAKTYIAVIGAVAYGIYQLTQGHFNEAITSFLAALGAAGLRSAVTQQTQQIEAVTAQQTEELKRAAAMPVTLKTTVTPRGDSSQST